jgi:hypothetical protein
VPAVAAAHMRFVAEPCTRRPSCMQTSFTSIDRIAAMPRRRCVTPEPLFY